MIHPGNRNDLTWKNYTQPAQPQQLTQVIAPSPVLATMFFSRRPRINLGDYNAFQQRLVAV